jgi:transglutaminase-like putative cysteine protease
VYNLPETRQTARTFTIPWGHAGIEVTVWHMRRLARRALGRPEVVESAQRVAGVGSECRQAQRIRAYLAAKVRFTHDPLGVELIRTPLFMLREIDARGWVPGDCDDVAVLGAAFGMAVGIRARYVLIGLTRGEPYEHVYTELLTDSGPVDLDTTRPAQMPPGVEILRTGFREA